MKYIGERTGIILVGYLHVRVKNVVTSSCECIMLLIQAVKSIIGEVFDDVSFEEFEEDSNVSQTLLCSNSYKPMHTQWKVVSLGGLNLEASWNIMTLELTVIVPGKHQNRGWVVTQRRCLHGSNYPVQVPIPDATLAAREGY